MGAIYYIECLDCTEGVQIGKRFGLVSDILTEKEMDELYEAKSLGGVPGESKEQDVTGSIIDAINGTDWFEYREVPKKLLKKIGKGYKKLIVGRNSIKTDWGWWNDAYSEHDLYKDVSSFCEKHLDHQVGWQDNGHLFGSRGLPTYHHPAHPKPSNHNKGV